MPLLAALALLGCSTPTDPQPYLGSCAPFEALSWQPLPNSRGVPRDTAIRLQLSDYPDPDTLDRNSLLLTTGPFWHVGSYAVDLIDKTVTFRPSNLLRPNLGYTATLFAPLRSLGGCPAVEAHRSFETGAGTEAAPPPVTTPFGALTGLLAASCSGAACHRAAPADGGGCLPRPALGLSLCDRDAVDALIGVPSRQLARLNLVEPRNAARSYLLRKLLPGASPASTTRGHGDPGAPLSPSELRAIASWIDSGASP